MQTTIDGAGRIVVPKSLREAMGLTAGCKLDIAFCDGRLEIEYAPTNVTVDLSERIPRLVADEDLPPLDEATVRAVLESTRR